ncbi:hypothetical protein GWI33_008191 [Rhynchophorus ferrugineus]|uniref:Uncharacterized protein n=1 Tax=Rhynchophorus ferrugineus TaxID=354439 RepID=A0A834IF03_RHYFE|nr:hypothetical protein GWI33_008191 [Rhynchophorus ferrugineus]
MSALFVITDHNTTISQITTHLIVNFLQFSIFGRGRTPPMLRNVEAPDKNHRDGMTRRKSYGTRNKRRTRRLRTERKKNQSVKIRCGVESAVIHLTNIAAVVVAVGRGGGTLKCRTQ